MNNKNIKIIKSEIVIIAMLVIAILLSNLIGTTTQTISGNYLSKKTFDDIKSGNPSVGCLIGTVVGDVIKKEFPNAEIRLYNTNEDVYQAVDSGVVNYGIGYAETIEEIAKSYENLKYIKEPIYTAKECFVLPKTEKGEKIRICFNDYIKYIKKENIYSKLETKWYLKDESKYKLEKYNFTGENGVLKIVTGGTWVPNTFIYDGEVVGFFIELMYGFCEKYGYVPEIYTTSYQGEIAGVAASEYDIMADIAEQTEEREKTVLLTDSILESSNVIIVNEKSTDVVTIAKKDVFFKKLKDGFVKNFIVDNRWKLIVQGLVVTILLSLLSAIFGTILGALICFFRMNKNSYFTAFARIYIKVIQSTPIVVLLMVFNYLVFNKFGFSAFVVSIFAFSIDFSAYVSEIFRSGIEAIPIGQKLAAKSLGFNKKQILTKIIIPQALIHILPVYSGQFIAMVKLTSVAGYISVVDLTKASDYIRSLTYEAFYPLISTAIIYFVLSNLLVKILGFFENKINLELHRKKVMKEVEKL